MHGRLFTFEFELFGSSYTLPFPSYFVLLLTGFLFATVMGAVWARRVGQNPDVIVDLGLATLLAGIVGSRLLHVLADGYFWDYVHLCTDPSKVEWQVSRQQCLEQYAGHWDMLRGVCRPLERDCLAWARFYAGGLTYYGGFIFASGAAYRLLRSDRFPFWKAADMAGMVIPIGIAFGRMGCLFAGCCFGQVTSGPWSMVFPGGSPASDAHYKLRLLPIPGMPSLPVHPTQIYEAAVSLGLAAFLILYFHGRKRYDGQVFVAFIASYAVARFVLEFFRADDRGGLLGLSTSQLLGVAMVIVAVVIHRRLSRAAAPPAAPPPSPPAGQTAPALS
jgi:phosphatidylglycerol:prolipoprotein diacylglycerol transferase